ncbi:sulfur oxidation protein SoxY [Chloroherpeton thalassium ATCC 35110]|uniref:Sulfur oxidation protein SoxY n=1 Tax=Chloroherpeton thalassium (strain ATCC 35110 / GB-78) TaxID=517418 RepID=B3QVQ9_CHLT3|nr:thiosulfate oxidation carrier protein SoxY [Chloroherpeton thalassium]ACF13116.1 sulfur oxidation protein SoxY [Chloroherpeton thalassium ATCC 35110]
MNRREFLQKALASAALASFVPGELFALWNKKAFSADDFQEALKAVYGNQNFITTDKIAIDVPDVATNSATVPISAKTDLKGVQSMAFFVEKNKAPLTLFTEFTPKMIPFLSTRIKMRETSNVSVVVKANGKYYITSKKVKVNAQAC